MGASSELLNILGDVKARVQDRLGVVDFPMPQFIIVGKQSVGKSRLIEALAGETFNFISGTLGSRRPTVLEFRNVPGAAQSKWFVRSKGTMTWEEHPISRVMQIVGNSHEELGATVSSAPTYVRVESANCVDMQIVDLPGFRDFALDDRKQDLANQIEDLDMSFMRDPKNVMVCVEQAGDAATMSTLHRCRELDPNLKRTILVRNKLDKYYGDLTPDTVNKWVNGFGDLPDGLDSFAMTLPWWPEGKPMEKSFVEITVDKDKEDVSQLKMKGISDKFVKTIGFYNFAKYMEKRVENMFVESIGPVLVSLNKAKEETDVNRSALVTEGEETDPQRILATTRDCGVSFAQALQHVMDGVLELHPVMNLEDELRDFHAHHEAVGSTHLTLLPTEDFAGLADYVDFLRYEYKLPTFDVELNGGAQYRRLMNEVEIFLRFSEIATETKKKDVIQAKGVSTSTLTWRDVVVKLLRNEAHQPLEMRVQYVGERIRFFFEKQKEAVLEFMLQIEHSANAALFSPLFAKHGKMIAQNEMMKKLVYDTYDQVCKRQYELFVDLFDSMLTSTFANPWVFLKSASAPTDDKEDLNDYFLPSFEDTKARIPVEIGTRAKSEQLLNHWLHEIPTDYSQVDIAVDRVQMLVLRTYSFIRSQVCDSVELFSESFFKLPMLRQLEDDMLTIQLSEDDQRNYDARRERLMGEIRVVEDTYDEIGDCIGTLQAFKLKVDAMKRRVV